MAVSMRASSAQVSVVRRSAPRVSVRPCAALKPAQLGAGLAALVVATCIVAPAEAHNVISTVASAAEGYPFVPPSWAPQVLVPLTGLVIPAVAMASLFVYIEAEK